MSETAKTAREAMKAKAKRLAAGDPHTKVDSSTWSPPEPENAGVKTGMRPLSKRQYKKGGKVVGKADGHKSHARPDRKPRKAGGKAEPDRAHRYLTPDNLLNRDVRMANEVREGTKHVGGLKHGGRAHKFSGGVGDNPVTRQSQMMGKAAGMMKKGGKVHHREHHDGSDGNVAGQSTEEALKKAREAIARSQSTMTGADADRARRAAQYDAEQQEYQRSMPQNQKDGGKVKWIQKAIKHKGALHKALHVPEGEKIPAKKLEKATHSSNPKLAKRAHLAETLKHMHHAKGGAAKHMSHEDEAADKALIRKMVKHDALTGKKHGGAAHPHDCTCHKCYGGRMGKYTGGGVFSGDSKSKVPGVTGGRQAHAKGGKAGKSKMNVNVIIATGHHAHPQDMMGNQPNAPVAAPRTMPAPAAGAPNPMMPPQMPAGMPAGMPMGRKSGGRAGTIHVIDHAAGGGLGRLEKVKAYGLTPPKRK